MDNIQIPLENNNSKLYDHVKTVVEKYKNEISFIEPQSMNYFIKLSKMYEDFAHVNKESSRS